MRNPNTCSSLDAEILAEDACRECSIFKPLAAGRSCHDDDLRNVSRENKNNKLPKDAEARSLKDLRLRV